jgi:hypothetical protein
VWLRAPFCGALTVLVGHVTIFVSHIFAT